MNNINIGLKKIQLFQTEFRGFVNSVQYFNKSSIDDLKAMR